MRLPQRLVIACELAIVVVHDRRTTDAYHRLVDQRSGWVVTALTEEYPLAISVMSQDVEMTIARCVPLRLEGTAVGTSIAGDEIEV